MSFDLEKAIAAWRRPYEVNPAFSTGDVDELEGSLRDRIEALTDTNLSEEQAFRIAIKRVGSYGSAETEYRKVYWGKVRRERRMKAALGWRLTMFKNYLTVDLRTLRKQKGYAFINIGGLAVGLACFTIILLYVHDELSYDQFHIDADRIHRVAHDQVGAGFNRRIIAAPGALKNAMLREIPEIEQATHLYLSYWGDALLSNEKYTYYDNRLLYVDDSFLDVFSFHFIHGDAQSAFADPASVVLTESVAERFFGNEDALGQTLTFNQNKPLRVTGIIEEVPAQSHLQFDFLTSTVTANRPEWENSWGQGHMHTYIKVKPQASLPEVETKIQRLIDTYHRDYMEAMHVQETYFAEPLAGINGIHLSLPGNKLYIQVLMLVAFFILFIAGINYVNLATARSARRAKEIGLRKVVGALRKSLIYQFLAESILIALVSGCLAVGLTEGALPFFNNLMQKELSLLAAESQPVWGFMAASIVVFGITAGLYPAFYLSAFTPISILKKQRVSKRTTLGLRKILVVTQFALSTFLIVGVLVVQQQMTYVQSTDLGFDKDQMIVIKNFNHTPNRDRNYTVRNALEALPGVLKVGGSVENILGLRGSATGSMRLNSQSTPVASLAQIVGGDYLDVFGLEFIEGQNFSPGPAADYTKVILNETAVRQLGIEGSAVGLKIGANAEQTVIGVVKDFHAASLHHEILPYAFLYSPDALQAIVKLSGGHIRETLSQIEATWKTFVPDIPLDFYFLDEAIDQQYRAEQNFNTLFSAMTGLILMIACLGLFALATFTAEQRTREIGIRKVLGASVTNVVTLLSKDFVKLVVLATIIAWPLAYVAMNAWLNNFAYRIDVGLWPFVLAGVLALVIAMLTVSYQAFRAATVNPVKTLRYE